MGFNYLEALRNKPLKEYEDPERLNVILPRDLRLPVAALVAYWNAEARATGDRRPRISRSHVIRVALEGMLNSPAIVELLRLSWEAGVDDLSSPEEAEAAIAEHLARGASR